MTSPAAAGEGLPALPPIKTAPSASPSPASDSKAAEDQETSPPAAEEQEPATPTSEESKLRPLTECPPAPRKPPRPPAKRKHPSKPRVFAVPYDLTAVFMSMPPKKRIRAG